MTAVLILFGNSAASFPESDKRCRVNGLRESFGVIGAPIRLSMRAGGESLRSQETEGVRDFGAIHAFSRRPLAKALPGERASNLTEIWFILRSNGLHQEATP
jgi:hypothetical protein